MTLDPDEAWDLVDRARANGRELLVCYPFQWTRHAEAARALITSGRLGELRLASVCYSSMAHGFLSGHPEEYDGIGAYPMNRPNPATYSDPVMAGGGQGQSQLTHALSNMLYVTGRHARTATAQARRFGLRVELALTVQLELDNDGLATFSSIGSLRPGQLPQQDFRYYFSEGVVLQDVVAGTLHAYANDGEILEWEALSPSEIDPSAVTSATLVELARGAGRNPAPADVGARTVEILASAYTSVAQGGACVPVRPDPT
jgi:predicted dehydrogenase